MSDINVLLKILQVRLDGMLYLGLLLKLKDVAKILMMVVDVNNPIKLKRKVLLHLLVNGQILTVLVLKTKTNLLSNLHPRWLLKCLGEFQMKMSHIWDLVQHFHVQTGWFVKY